MEKITVADLCDDLLQHIKSDPIKFKDQRNPPYRIGLIQKAFGERPAASVTAMEINQWLNGITGKAPATINRLKVTFSSLYRYGKLMGKVDVNPARDVPAKAAQQ